MGLTNDIVGLGTAALLTYGAVKVTDKLFGGKKSRHSKQCHFCGSKHSRHSSCKSHRQVSLGGSMTDNQGRIKMHFGN